MKNTGKLSSPQSSEPAAPPHGEETQGYPNKGDDTSGANVEVDVLAVAGSSQALDNPITEAAEGEFDRFMLELCSANPPIQGHESWFDRFIGHAPMKRANRVIAIYQELRLALSLLDNSEYWQAARDGLLALKAGNVHLAANIASSLTLATSKSSSLARVMLGLVCYLLVGMALVSAYLNIGTLQFVLNPGIFFKSLENPF